MNPPADFEFQWLSWLGLSVVLFSLYGLLSLIVGIVIPFVFRKLDTLPGGILFFSQEMDTQLFGHDTFDLVQKESSITLLRFLYITWLAGLFVSFGIFQLALAWFGLRRGYAWALWTLTLGDLALFPYFVRTIQIYISHRVKLRPVELPPLYTLLAIIPFAVLLGWLGLQELGAL